MTPELVLTASPSALVYAEEGGPATPTVPTTWVVLSAEEPLVAESLRIALRRHQLDASVVTWPNDGDPGTSGPHRRNPVPGGIGLALAEMAAESELEGIRRLVGAVPARWLLLAHRGPNPLWGAALDLRVDAVLPSSTPLGALVDVIARAARGERLMDQRQAEALREAWHDVLDVDTLRPRIRSLSERETQVLRLLYGGTGVSEIARALDVSASTVRTHVAAVLRKLGVASQLRAVATYAEYLDRTGWTAQ